jgi:predicted nucleic acid-binding protein
VSVAAPFDGRVYIADTSVWDRLDRLPSEKQDEWERALANQRIATTPLVITEILYSVQSPQDFDYWSERLGEINRVAYITSDVQAAAIVAYGEIAHQGSHRWVPYPDLYTAAAAHANHWGVLHYDGHFDRFAALASLSFESRWIVPAGSIP